MCGCRKGRKTSVAKSNSRKDALVEVIAGPYRGKMGVVLLSPRPGVYRVRLASDGDRNFYTSFLRFTG